MGGGHSHPQSTQNNGVTITTTSTGDSHNSFNNITSGGGDTHQGATSTGATVKTGVKVTAVPALLQNLALQGIDVSSIK